MPIEFQARDQQLIYSLPREFDAHVVSVQRAELEDKLNAPAITHVLDLSAVEFIDSSGIGAIVFLYKRLKATGRKMVLVGAKGHTAETLQMLRVDKVIPSASRLEDVK